MIISLNPLKPARQPEYYEDKVDVSEIIDYKNTKLVQREISNEEVKASVLKHK